MHLEIGMTRFSFINSFICHSLGQISFGAYVDLSDGHSLDQICKFLAISDLWWISLPSLVESSKIPKRTNLKIVPFCPELHKTLVKFNQNLLIKLFFLDFTIRYRFSFINSFICHSLGQISFGAYVDLSDGHSLDQICKFLATSFL
jgi:hypothetical protein